jgi:tetratricopeptide (TPR) repeat protein
MGKEATAVSERRSADPKRLAERLRGDLNWIVLKALEKDRTRRYETADALAADIQHHLHHEPVSVGPPAATYRLQKFIRRNRNLVMAGTAVAAALLVGLVLALAGLLEARHEREVARAQATKAEGILNMLEQMLSAADPTVGKGPDYKVRELLDEFTAGLSDRMQGQPPDVEAAILGTIGKTYGRLGLQYSAATHLRKACDLRRSQRGEDPHKLADSLTDMAWNAISRCSYEEAEKLAKDAVTIYAEMRTQSSVPASAKDVLTEAQHDLQLQRIARDGIAAYRHEEANEEIDRLLAESHVSPQGTLFALLFLVKLDVGDYVAAQRFATEHIQSRRGSRSTLDQNSYKLGLFCQAFAHHMHGQLDMARPLYAHLKPSSERFTPDENLWVHMIDAWAILNSEPISHGDVQWATGMIQEVAEWISSVPATPFVKWQVYHTLACAHAKAGNLEEAIAAERKALDTIPPFHLFCRSASEQVLADYLVQHGDLDGAEILLRDAVRWRQEKLPPTYVQNSVAEMNLADFLIHRGDEPSYIEAVNLLERACQRLQDRPRDDYYKRRSTQQLTGLYAELMFP